jgi:ribonuclease VapC
MSTVLDSSAVLSVLWNEAGNELVLDRVDGAVISAVNHAEVLTKIADRGVDSKRTMALLKSLAIETIGFDQAQAEAVGLLRSQTRHLGLSLGDRACLALAMLKGWPVLTADKAWAKLSLGLDVQLLR